MTASEKPWTPEYKLRADASSEQIMSRHLALECEIGGLNAIEQVARELASAVSAETTTALEAIYGPVAVELEALKAQCTEKDAEIARLRAELNNVTIISAYPVGTVREVMI